MLLTIKTEYGQSQDENLKESKLLKITIAEKEQLLFGSQEK
jgi:hypothetical protein